MYERILVPLDGSNLAELAIPYAEELARLFDSDITLLCVCEQSQYRHMHQLYLDKTAQLIRDRIRERNPVATVKTAVVDGNPAEGIITYAAENAATLITMGTHGRSGIVPWALGSTASKVLHRTNTPVLLVRAGEAAVKPARKDMFSRILAPLDGSEAGRAALPHAAAIADGLGTDLILFQAVAPGQHVHTVGGLDYVAFPRELLDSMKEHATKYLQTVARELGATHARVKVEVTVGDAAQEIIRFAGESGASLVAMSTHGHSEVRHWFFGSTTHKVLHGGKTPVLLVNAPEAKPPD